MSTVVAANPLGLPVGTLVEEIGRSEMWDHHGCIPSIRTVHVELRLVETGEVVRGILEQAYADGEPWPEEPWLRG